MEVMVILVPLALGLGLVGLLAFLWSLKSGQYDDLEGAAWRAIADDDEPAAPRLALRPGAIEVAPQALADALHLGGEQDDGNVGDACNRLHGAKGGRAIHAGHHDIHQDCVRLKPWCYCNSLSG